MKILKIIWKNILVLINSRLSATILILGPFIITLLAGLVLSGANQIKDVKVGLYAPESSDIKEVLLKSFKERSFKIDEFNNLEDCIDSVRKETNNVCLEIKQKETSQTSKYTGTKLNYKTVLYLDFSKQRIVWVVIAAVESGIKEESSKITEGITDDLERILDRTSTELKNKKASLKDTYREIDIIQSDVNNAKSKVNSISIDPNIIDILELELIERDLIFIASIVDPLHPAQSNINDLLLRISRVRSKAYSIQSDILVINSLKQDALRELDSINSALSSIRNRILDVESKINEIESELAEIKKINFKEITNPIPVEYSPVTSASVDEAMATKFSLIDYIMPSFLVLFLMFVAMIFSTNIVIKERKSSSNIRNMISPTSNLTFLVSTYLTSLILISIQSIILLGVAEFFLTLEIFKNFIPIFFFLLLAISVFTLIGMFIGYLFNSYDTAILGSISATVIFLLFSSFITPLETIPPSLNRLVSYTPFMLFESIARKIVIFNTGLTNIIPDILAIFLYIAITLILLVVISKLRRKTNI